MAAKNTKVHVDEGVNQINPGASYNTQINNFYGGSDKLSEPVGPTVVLGQKVDVAIGMPSSDCYARQLYLFLQTSLGKTLNTWLRSRLPGMTFNFDNLDEDALNCLLDNFETKFSAVCGAVTLELRNNPKLTDRQRGMGRDILAFFKQLKQVYEQARMNAHTKHFLVSSLHLPVTDDSILTCDSTILSATFKKAVRSLMRLSICEEDNPVLRPVYDILLCAEERLERYFVGFQTRHETDVNNSLYVSWMLWAFLAKRQQSIIQRAAGGAQLPRIYDSLAKVKCKVINLNYTTFASRFAPHCQVLNLWGDLAHYTDVKNKNVFPLEPEDLCHIERFFREHLMGEICFKTGHEAYPMPMFYSPLEQMAEIPLPQLINLTEAAHRIGQTRLLILVGCDLAAASNLFREMLQANNIGRIIVVDNDLETLAAKVADIYSIDRNRYTQQVRHGHVQRVYNNRITLVQCDPGRFDLTKYIDPSAG